MSDPRSTSTAAKRPAGKARRVMIVEDETLVAMGLRALLEQLNYTIVAEAGDAQQAIAMFDQHSPDLVLMDIRLGEAQTGGAQNGGAENGGAEVRGDGIDVSTKLLERRHVPIVIISAYSDDALHARAAAAGVFGYLIKPVSREALAAQIAIAIRRFNETESLREENQTLAQTLEVRKLVERAKGILMKRLNLDEAAAHKRLQSESQQRRISISDIAKRVIESEKLLGG